jgi:hypothetical protein
MMNGRPPLHALALCLSALLARAAPPLPNQRQLDFMELEFTQFMHFNVDTAWQAPDSFLRGPNPTYHNCEKTWVGVDHGSQTSDHYPCLNAEIFVRAAVLLIGHVLPTSLQLVDPFAPPPLSVAWFAVRVRARRTRRSWTPMPGWRRPRRLGCGKYA